MSDQCSRCHRPIGVKPAVTLSDQTIHEACFNCAKCGNGFPDLKFTRENNEFYHRECLDSGETVYCTGCMNQIESSFTRYEGKPYHKQCFVCSKCRGQLGQTFGETPDGRPLCDNCLSSTPISEVAHDTKVKENRNCISCQKPIYGDGYSLSNGHAVHTTCVQCGVCKQFIDSYDTKSFIEKSGVFYHTPDCYNKSRFELCTKCQKPLFGGGIPMKGGKYHEECVLCTYCGSNMVGKDYTWHNQQICCKGCAPLPTKAPTQSNTGTESAGFGTQDKCPKCRKAVYVSDQVFGPNATVWHSKCLVCTQCNTKLSANAKTVDGLLYCSLHAKPKNQFS